MQPSPVTSQGPESKPPLLSPFLWDVVTLPSSLKPFSWPLGCCTLGHHLLAPLLSVPPKPPVFPPAGLCPGPPNVLMGGQALHRPQAGPLIHASPDLPPPSLDQPPVVHPPTTVHCCPSPCHKGDPVHLIHCCLWFMNRPEHSPYPCALAWEGPHVMCQSIQEKAKCRTELISPSTLRGRYCYPPPLSQGSWFRGEQHSKVTWQASA